MLTRLRLFDLGNSSCKKWNGRRSIYLVADLVGLPLSFCCFSLMIQDSNELSGSIPKEIGMLSELTFLDLGKLSCICLCPFNVDLPLLTLIQDSTGLVGTIPTEIGMLSQLTVLDFGKSSCRNGLVVLLFDYLCLKPFALSLSFCCSSLRCKIPST